ncbi:hypothetical protein K458DRAFT_447400 [Lentithecium fluviatile CBS 122367]|uniref:Uncharacterized protein n=1 Tax=Lentithecium fluviatile CBS 122367 TaxID=1168545 RepID=A0A6G1IEC9_9PLEO|nr:hypothetical protein K458DRAFT_447400 [Lentithecium fluviatile CBS 122367]
MTFLRVFLLSLAANVLAAPKPPAVTFLYSANVTSGAPTIIGSTPLGNRVVIPIISGEFSGPKLSGKIFSGTIWSLTSPTGINTADAIYVMQTTDGATIMVTEKAHIPNIDIFFETASPKYGWLNNVTAFASETPTNGVASINVFAIGSTL